MRYTQWQIFTASEQVEKEIRALPADMKARYVRLTQLIEQHGLGALSMPNARPVKGKLWELRIKGRDGIARALYVAVSGRRVVILHAFVKKTQKTPRRAIDIAQRRLEELTL